MIDSYILQGSTIVRNARWSTRYGSVCIECAVKVTADAGIRRCSEGRRDRVVYVICE